MAMARGGRVPPDAAPPVAAAATGVPWAARLPLLQGAGPLDAGQAGVSPGRSAGVDGVTGSPGHWQA